ncbi:MAG TPA: hypothetical protein VG871_10610, partial [Vicinamibacterales bacterium]|nr:hypothetical protein [Vicinamibacterales bacterium]
GTFADKRVLTRELTAALMKWEKVPPLAMFIDNTAAFVHELPADAMSDAKGDGHCVRVEILTPEGVLDRTKKLGVVQELTEIIARAAGDATLAARTWVLISEAPDGGWGIGGHAYTNAEIAETARAALAKG